jgi:hypothetical protein
VLLPTCHCHALRVHRCCSTRVACRARAPGSLRFPFAVRGLACVSLPRCAPLDSRQQVCIRAARAHAHSLWAVSMYEYARFDFCWLLRSKISPSTAISLTEQLKPQLPQSQELVTRRLVPYIVRRVMPNAPVGRKLQHFKCISKEGGMLCFCAKWLVPLWAQHRRILIELG